MPSSDRLARFAASNNSRTGYLANGQPAPVHAITFKKDTGLVTRILEKLNNLREVSRSGVFPVNNQLQEIERELESLRERCFLVDSEASKPDYEAQLSELHDQLTQQQEENNRLKG